MSKTRRAAARGKSERAIDLLDAEGTGKRPFVEPKLTFVTPKLVKHGGLAEITGQGFFGPFSPPPSTLTPP
jgi:hypothetical protein